MSDDVIVRNAVHHGSLHGSVFHHMTAIQNTSIRSVLNVILSSFIEVDVVIVVCPFENDLTLFQGFSRDAF